ncbi:MAG: pyridoxamine 5'-phosphate oxidase family protein [Pseudomonadales bacterium]|nr:pyridoxamine 5'-phosphate oxidase family protein [Pseudomonadales bacterium]
MLISKSSAWPRDQLVSYLSQVAIPMRIATYGEEFPSICSVWYFFDPDRDVLLCASHKNSLLVKQLLKNDKCAFEIAPNDPPYKGVRGRGRVILTRVGVEETLHKLIGRYLGDSNDSLARWLLDRKDDEYVLELSPSWITSWDYGHRMERTSTEDV